nr:hypothetical protein [uncultured Hyphomonas sp.]
MRTLFGLLTLLVTAALPAQAERGETSGVYHAPATALRGAPPLEAYAGGSSVVILFQPHCPWCLKQFREAEAFAEARPDVPILAASLKGSRADLISELNRAHTDLPAYRSSPALLQQLGEPEGTPRIYVLNADGTITAVARGLQDIHALEALVSSSELSSSELRDQ